MQTKTNTYDLLRFVKAQEQDYATALAEIKSGRKRSHWMWYIFPQIAGLGFSSTAQYYAIKNLGEAVAYLQNELLSSRLTEICSALLALSSNNASEIFGYPDDMKLRSSMTLFEAASCSTKNIFAQVLDKFFAGERDERTLEIIEKDAR